MSTCVDTRAPSTTGSPSFVLTVQVKLVSKKYNQPSYSRGTGTSAHLVTLSFRYSVLSNFAFLIHCLTCLHSLLLGGSFRLKSSPLLFGRFRNMFNLLTSSFRCRDGSVCPSAGKSSCSCRLICICRHLHGNGQVVQHIGFQLQPQVSCFGAPQAFYLENQNTHITYNTSSMAKV